MDEDVARLSELTLTVQGSDLRQLETEELDALLGIDHLQTPETLRSQRARMISRVNTEYQVLYGQDLIVRGQSPEDRRRSVYFIRPA
jgi:DNA-binding MarR family transcriptional regulator